jgi:hypothetical protein
MREEAERLKEEAGQTRRPIEEGPATGRGRGRGGRAAQQPAPEDYEELTVPELKELASKRGLEVASDARKDDIIDALKEDDKNHRG